MMNDIRFLQAPTIFSKYYGAGARIAVVTVKDKRRAFLGAGLSFNANRAICISSERAEQATILENGIENLSLWLKRELPEVYSGALSEFVLATECKLLEEWQPNVMYSSTTDHFQHKFAPHERGTKEFRVLVDEYLRKLDAWSRPYY